MTNLDRVAAALYKSRPDLSEDRINQILDFIDDELVYEVEVPHARVAVETRDVGGLSIGFDASGHAVRVEFPVGGMAS